MKTNNFFHLKVSPVTLLGSLHWPSLVKLLLHQPHVGHMVGINHMAVIIRLYVDLEPDDGTVAFVASSHPSQYRPASTSCRNTVRWGCTSAGP